MVWLNLARHILDHFGDGGVNWGDCGISRDCSRSQRIEFVLDFRYVTLVLNVIDSKGTAIESAEQMSRFLFPVEIRGVVSIS